uniref:Uncharacterized protein n=1 Tax=Oryza rufipogon TaxID=4529 RepID=A0A0E0RAS5_ORYRU
MRRLAIKVDWVLHPLDWVGERWGSPLPRTSPSSEAIFRRLQRLPHGAIAVAASARLPVFSTTDRLLTRHCPLAAPDSHSPVAFGALPSATVPAYRHYPPLPAGLLPSPLPSPPSSHRRGRGGARAIDVAPFRLQTSAPPPPCRRAPTPSARGSAPPAGKAGSGPPRHLRRPPPPRCCAPLLPARGDPGGGGWIWAAPPPPTSTSPPPHSLATTTAGSGEKGRCRIWLAAPPRRRRVAHPVGVVGVDCATSGGERRPRRCRPFGPLERRRGGGEREVGVVERRLRAPSRVAPASDAGAGVTTAISGPCIKINYKTYQ